MFQNGLLKGKRILVTGGGTGLGREIATKYLQLAACRTGVDFASNSRHGMRAG